MKAFTYERATDAAAAVAAVPAPGAKFISGGTNLLDLMKLEIEQPTHLVDISRLPLKQIEETARRRAAHRRPGRRTPTLAADARVRSSLPGALASSARRRIGPAAQQGIGRRQPAAAHALPLLL